MLPGHIGAIRFKTNEGVSAPPHYTLPIQPGAILNLRDIEQALENLKRVPTVEADFHIEPAKNVQALTDSDIIITYHQNLPLRFSATVDDSGSKSAGVYQASTTLSWDSPLHLNDLFYFTSNRDLGGGDPGSRGTQGYTLHYSLPFNYWSLSSTYTSSRNFHDVAGLNQDYNYHGTSENTEIKLSRLLYRDTLRKTRVHLRAWQRRNNSFIDDTEILVQRRVVGGWELRPGSQRCLRKCRHRRQFRVPARHR